ncbi:MAG: pyruvate formate lyase-activating protein [Lentisphaeria bacterium]|nr:pyruvate formate lyase-activating protein [Lentisphaeria bacterium]
MTGRVHSFESFGTLDGPGVRFIVFLQGCPLRCCYCHNPDTWDVSGGREYTVSEVMAKIKSCRSYIRSGGVTLSGGEPLLQRDFTLCLLENCRAEGFHTALDTAGSVSLEYSKKVIDTADMLLLDIKSLDDKQCRQITGQGNKNTLATLDYCEESGKTVWIRHVVVPQLTLDTERLKELSNYLEKYSCIKRVDLLGYHKMGEYKWESLGINNILKDTCEPAKSELEEAQKLFCWSKMR